MFEMFQYEASAKANSTHQQIELSLGYPNLQLRISFMEKCETHVMNS